MDLQRFLPVMILIKLALRRVQDSTPTRMPPDLWIFRVCRRHNESSLLSADWPLLGFPCGSASKESTCNVEDLGLFPGLGRSPEEKKGYPLQYPGLENSYGLYSPWGRKESDTTDPLSLSYMI